MVYLTSFFSLQAHSTASKYKENTLNKTVLNSTILLTKIPKGLAVHWLTERRQMFESESEDA